MQKKYLFPAVFFAAMIAAPWTLYAQQAAQTKPHAGERERQIKLEGQGNFRDLGGYRTTDGHTVRWGMLYRSGQLSKLSDADLARLKALNIRTVVDLRSTNEVETRGKDRLPEGVRGVSLPIDPGSLPKEDPAAGSDASGRTDLMLQMTRSIMIHRTDVYSALVRELAEPGNRPLVYHCTAGKDRAGIGTAVILSLLGVPWETVREDYLLSNFYRREENEKELKTIREGLAQKQGISPDKVDMTGYDGMFFVKPEYLDAAHDAVIKRYGSMEAYLQKGLGNSEDTIKKLRRDLLE